jgi:hypothetical protein
MSITINDKNYDFFRTYEELAHTYIKEIDGYRTLIKAIEVMIDQKERNLQNIKDKAIALMKQSIASPEITSLQEEQHVDAAVEHLPTEVVSSLPVQERKKRSVVKTRAAGKRGGKVVVRSKTPAAEKKETKCLYHPESPAVDIGKQLCSSCKWKLRANGLVEYDKNPSVISFLQGKLKSIPIVGQPMCPVHPTVPAYNKKTGLCARCQSKAIGFGVTDRPLTKVELDHLRNPSS